jgi:hypothetical protein
VLFFFPSMPSQNPFFGSGPEPAILCDHETSFGDTAGGLRRADGLGDVFFGAVTLTFGTTTLLPSSDDRANLAAEGEESCKDSFGNTVLLVILVCRGLVTEALGSDIVLWITVSQIEKVFVDSCLDGDSNVIGAPSIGVNNGGGVAGILVTGVLVAGRCVVGDLVAGDFVADYFKAAIRALLLGISSDGCCEVISWNRSYSA